MVDVVVVAVVDGVVVAVVVELNLAKYNERRLQCPREISGKEIFLSYGNNSIKLKVL